MASPGSAPLVAARKPARPMRPYKTVHTGMKILFGGVQDGSLSTVGSEYQELVALTTKGVPAAPPKIEPATQTGAGATADTAAARGARLSCGACRACAAVARMTALYISSYTSN